MRNLVGRKGFTLIELIIVIAILGILAMILMPQVIIFIERAKIAADQTTVRTLNSVTSLYGIDKKIIDSDIFEGFDTDEQRIAELVDDGLLRSIVKPQIADALFVWDVENQYWLYYISVSDDSSIVYYLLTDSDYELGSWGTTTIGNYINETEKNIQLPEGIVSIKGGQSVSAFYERGLESVMLPSSLKNIYSHAFYGNNLTEITMPSEVTFVGTRSFYNNPITKITMANEPENVTIQDRAFGTGYTESKIVTDSFIAAYTNGGPGTYEWIDNAWIKTN
jgi:prepilin-type N-terminal cleavage/methylation domain-containing protein